MKNLIKRIYLHIFYKKEHIIDYNKFMLNCFSCEAEYKFYPICPCVCKDNEYLVKRFKFKNYDL